MRNCVTWLMCASTPYAQSARAALVSALSNVLRAVIIDSFSILNNVVGLMSRECSTLRDAQQPRNQRLRGERGARGQAQQHVGVDANLHQLEEDQIQAQAEHVERERPEGGGEGLEARAAQLRLRDGSGAASEGKGVVQRLKSKREKKGRTEAART